MQNYFANETEAAHRQREWERALVASARTAPTRPPEVQTSWPWLPHRLLGRLRALARRWWPRAAWSATPEGRQLSIPVVADAAT